MGSDAFKSGFVALIGRPNSGKSTLINAIMGEKLAITADKPQTTRRSLRAIRTTESSQMVFVDTPGLHRPKDALGAELNSAALSAMKDSDIVLFLVDGSADVGKGDVWIAEQLKEINTPIILVITKLDLIDQSQALSQIESIQKILEFKDVIALSATSEFNVAGLLKSIENLLPSGPKWYEAETNTDMKIEDLIAEFIREKVMRRLREEVPYAVEVSIKELTYDKKRNLTSIFAVLYVERDSQKGIVIGSKGAQVKSIGIAARKELEKLMGTQVHLDLQVQVLKDWRSNQDYIERFGYGE